MTDLRLAYFPALPSSRLPIVSGILERRNRRRRFRTVDAAYRVYQHSDLAREHQAAWRTKHRMPPIMFPDWVTGEPPDRRLEWETLYRINVMAGKAQCYGCGSEADQEPGVLYGWGRRW